MFCFNYGRKSFTISTDAIETAGWKCYTRAIAKVNASTDIHLIEYVAYAASAQTHKLLRDALGKDFIRFCYDNGTAKIELGLQDRVVMAALNNK